jgi:2-dehydro-3-deoxyphosphogalactonate aldolase
MKLREIRTFVVDNPAPHNGGRYFIFAKLTTADGICGVGEAYGVPFEPHHVAKLIEDVFGRYLEGEDPHDIERIWRRVYSSGYSQHPDLTVMGVLSALEMACWDIIGKAVCTNGCAPTPTFMPGPAIAPTSIRIPTWRRSGPRNISRRALPP